MKFISVYPDTSSAALRALGIEIKHSTIDADDAEEAEIRVTRHRKGGTEYLVFSVLKNSQLFLFQEGDDLKWVCWNPLEPIHDGAELEAEDTIELDFGYNEDSFEVALSKLDGGVLCKTPLGEAVFPEGNEIYLLPNETKAGVDLFHIEVSPMEKLYSRTTKVCDVPDGIDVSVERAADGTATALVLDKTGDKVVLDDHRSVVYVEGLPEPITLPGKV